jgi:hypothetical protein
MSTFDLHCHDSLLQFGQQFEEVHRWLDEFAGKPRIASPKILPCRVFCLTNNVTQR